MSQNKLLIEHLKILSLLNEARDSKFVTIKGNIVNDDSKANYGVGNRTTYGTEVLKSLNLQKFQAFVITTMFTV